VGKTVLLRQLSRELEDSLYISLDALLPGISLFELAKELSHSVTLVLGLFKYITKFFILYVSPHP